MMTRTELLEVVYRFYPRRMAAPHPEYRSTEESRRYQEALRIAIAEYPRWQGLLGRLRTRSTLADWSLHLFGSAPADGGYSGELQVPGGALSFHVSFLGPYYAVHRRGAPGEEPAASEAAKEIEAAYGYEPIPAEIGYGMVPDVEIGAQRRDTATLNECLFSGGWSWSSYDDGPAAARVEEDIREGDPVVVIPAWWSREKRRAHLRALLAMDESDEEKRRE